MRSPICKELHIKIKGFDQNSHRKLPNSVLWLYANNKLEEAEEILLKAAKMNNITFTQPILNSYNKFDDSKLSSNSSKINGKIKNIMKLCCMKAETSSNAYKYSVLDIFKSKMLFKHLVVCLFMGLVINWQTRSFHPNLFRIIRTNADYLVTKKN